MTESMQQPFERGDAMNIRPIRTEVDYEMALAEIERLFDAEPDTPQGDQLEVLTTLVEAYEAQHYPIPAPDPIEAIEYYMESRGLSRVDLEPYIGSRARVAEVLNRRRPLSLGMIRRLHGGLGIAADVLIQSYSTTIPTHRVPTHPGEMLLEEFLAPMGLTQQQLADAIHVPYQRVNELVNGRRGMTPSTALRLAKFFGMSADFWMNLQMRWDLYQAQQSEASYLATIEPHRFVVHPVG
jgi:HTH-type transcriptional regulator/antitoxin HigA